jgi:hypothetical protein
METPKVAPAALQGAAQMQQRRRFKQDRPLEERLAEEAKRLRAKARSIRPGAHRAELLRKAAQIEAGARGQSPFAPSFGSHGEDAEVRRCPSLEPT